MLLVLPGLGLPVMAPSFPLFGALAHVVLKVVIFVDWGVCFTGSMASEGMMATDNDTEGGNTGPSTAPSTEQPFSQELLAQIRQLKAQKAKLETSLGQQLEDAHLREQELLDEVASARDAASHSQQQTEAVDQKRGALEEVHGHPTCYRSLLM